MEFWKGNPLFANISHLCVHMQEVSFSAYIKGIMSIGMALETASLSILFLPISLTGRTTPESWQTDISLPSATSSVLSSIPGRAWSLLLAQYVFLLCYESQLMVAKRKLVSGNTLPWMIWLYFSWWLQLHSHWGSITTDHTTEGCMEATMTYWPNTCDAISFSIA